MGLALLVLRHGEFEAMLGASILASLLFSFPYSIRRTSEYFGIGWKEVLFDWARPALRLGTILLPLAAITAWSTHSLDSLVRLIVCGGTVAAGGVLLLGRIGMDEPTRREFSTRVPAKPAALLGLR